MTATLTAGQQFHPGTTGELLECPHCGAAVRMVPAALPDFSRLLRERPAQVGLVVTCTACQTPVFLRYQTRSFRDDRVELQALPAEQGGTGHRLGLNYLPAPVAERFREALACHEHGLWQAFAAMCRQTASALFIELGEPGRLRLYEQAGEVQRLADIDPATFATVRRVLFDATAPRGALEPAIDRVEAAALLETLKDLLFQTYVRPARLRQSLRVRRFFAQPDEAPPADVPSPRHISNL